MLSTGLALAGGLALWGAGVPSASAASAADVRHWSGKRSANGWPVVFRASRRTAAKRLADRRRATA
ncbi:hypothetical protein [Streptomyces sp. NPDC059479]|uniref:hypothetical protein n=1 Tax=Streptomyces sp. NPDC059479 TaxID=3346848 RepID=UPI0036A21910